MKTNRYKFKTRFLIVYLAISISSLYANTLQYTINNANEGSVLKLSKGIYEGKLFINKPISIIGKEPGVIIKGDSTGDVITITSSNVNLENITIINSGSRLENLLKIIQS